MFPSRLYGALPRVLIMAVLLAVLVCVGLAHARAAERFNIDSFADRVAAQVLREPIDFGALFAPPTYAVRSVFRAPMTQRRFVARGSVAALVEARARAWGVPVRLALAVARYESGFRMSMHGRAGERGAMQILPKTARAVGVTCDLYGPAGIEAGLRYLHRALATQGRYGLCAALSAYNHGLGHVSCTRYGAMILRIAAGGRA